MIDLSHIRLYKPREICGPGVVLAPGALSFARFLPGDRVPESWLN
jgi:hypothetical protein